MPLGVTFGLVLEHIVIKAVHSDSGRSDGAVGETHVLRSIRQRINVESNASLQQVEVLLELILV